MGLYGLFVFTGAILWKEERLDWPNFKDDFIHYSGEIVSYVKTELEARSKEDSMDVKNNKKLPTDPEDLKKIEPKGVINIKLEKNSFEHHNKNVRIKKIEVLFSEANDQLKKAQPNTPTYKSQLRKVLEAYKKVVPLCESVLKESDLSSGEKARVESILTESQKQIYWSNKFGGA